MQNVSVHINNKIWIGWDDVSITRSMDEASSSFSLAVSSKINTENDPVLIKIGSRIKIYYGNDLVLSGIIDGKNIDYDATNYSFRINGRSATKDLIDSSVEDISVQYNKTPHQLAEWLAKPFGIKVKSNNISTEVIPEFKVKTDGETAFEALDRIASAYGFSITDTPEGDLLLTTTAKNKTKNVLVNKPSAKENTGVLSASITIAEGERFNKVIVKGQYKASDENYGKAANQISGKSTDSNVRQGRVKILVSDTATNQQEADKQADWHKKAGQAKGNDFSYTVLGWVPEGGELWRENTLVHVSDEMAYIDKELLIKSVDYNISNGSGTTVTLSLVLPECYEKDPSDKEQAKLLSVEKAKTKAKEKAKVKSKDSSKDKVLEIDMTEIKKFFEDSE